ncbi:MAG: hypothetical protein IPH53_07510 [Flavobacteriales bacterium]|nr:hypothetical protein [Flavobacteriales bacterium]
MVGAVAPATALNDVWEYDPSADSWTQRSDFPGSARYSCVSVAASTKGIHRFGPCHVVERLVGV